MESLLPTWDELREPQRLLLSNVEQAYKEGDEEIYGQVACGVGKTLVYFKAIGRLDIQRVVLVVPTLVLLRQMKHDYIDRYNLPNWEYVCSEDGSEFTSVENYNGEGHVLTTYASLPRIESYFELCILDEAHRFQDKWNYADCFWHSSATLDPDLPLHYRYDLIQAIKDGYAQDFTIECFVRSKDKQADLAQLLNDIAIETGNRKMLVFTRSAETDERSVNTWMKEHAQRIRSLGGWVEGLTSKSHSLSTRTKIVREFKDRSEWSVLVSCRILAEGIDLKGVEGVVFVDPKTSRVQIIQCVGRPRKKAHDRPSTILVPIFVDPEKYNGSKENVSAKIEADMSTDEGDFKSLFNVLAVLRQEYPDWESFDSRPTRGSKNAARGSLCGEHIRAPKRLNIHVEASLQVLWSLEGSGDLRRSVVTQVLKSALSFQEKTMERAREFKAYYDKHGKPSAKSKKEYERKLAHWFRSQRRSKAKNSITSYEEVNSFLASFLGEDWYDKVDRECLVRKMMGFAEELKKFYEEKNRTPSLRNGDENEQKLARWFGGQKQAKNSKIPSRTCYAEVDEFLGTFLGPEWSQLNDSYFFTLEALKKCEQLDIFLKEHKRRPTTSANIAQCEISLAKWLRSMQKIKRGSKGTLYKEVEDKLVTILGESWYEKLSESSDLRMTEKVAAFVLKYGHAPSRSEDATLVNWIGTQRCFARGKGRKESNISVKNRLQDILGENWTQTKAERSKDQLTTLCGFVRSEGREPLKYRNIKNDRERNERELAQFLERKRDAKHGKGTSILWSGEDDILVDLLGVDWAEKTDLEKRALQTAADTEAFYVTNGCLPRRSSKNNVEEWKLYIFLKNLKRGKRCNDSGKASSNVFYQSVYDKVVSFAGEGWERSFANSLEAKSLENFKKFRKAYIDDDCLPTRSTASGRWLQNLVNGIRNPNPDSMKLYPGVAQGMKSLLGDNWWVPVGNKRATKRKTSSSDTTITLVKRPRLNNTKHAKFSSMTRSELIEQLKSQSHRVRGEFPADVRQDDEAKIHCNMQVVQAAKETKSLIVFLDSPAMNTTKYLVDAGIPLERMICPQLDTKEYELMKDWPHVRQGSLRVVLDSVGAKSYPCIMKVELTV